MFLRSTAYDTRSPWSEHVSSSLYPVHCIQFTGFGWAVRSGAIISDLLGLVIFSAWNHCFAYAGQITLLSVAAIRRYLIIVRGYPQRSTSGRFISAAKSLDELAQTNKSAIQ